MFSRVVEKRQDLKTKKNKDEVDLAIVKMDEILEKLNKQTQNIYDLEKKLFNLKIIKITDTAKHTKELEKREQLRLDFQTARLAVLTEIDRSSDWIYRYQSAAGEAFVRTRDEAVELASKFAIIDNKLLTNSKKLERWKEENYIAVVSMLRPIKLGLDGGSFQFPVPKI